MSLLQSSKAVQMLLKHDRNPISSLNLLSDLGVFSYSTEITTTAIPLSSKNYGFEKDTCDSAAPARKVAEENEWHSPYIIHSIPPAQGFGSPAKN